MKEYLCPECEGTKLHKENLKLFGEWFTCLNCGYQFDIIDAEKRINKLQKKEDIKVDQRRCNE